MNTGDAPADRTAAGMSPNAADTQGKYVDERRRRERRRSSVTYGNDANAQITRRDARPYAVRERGPLGRLAVRRGRGPARHGRRHAMGAAHTGGSLGAAAGADEQVPAVGLPSVSDSGASSLNRRRLLALARGLFSLAGSADDRAMRISPSPICRLHADRIGARRRRHRHTDRARRLRLSNAFRPRAGRRRNRARGALASRPSSTSFRASASARKHAGSRSYTGTADPLATYVASHRGRRRANRCHLRQRREPRASLGRRLSLTPYETATREVFWLCGNAVPGLGLQAARLRRRRTAVRASLRDDRGALLTFEMPLSSVRCGHDSGVAATAKSLSQKENSAVDSFWP